MEKWKRFCGNIKAGLGDSQGGVCMDRIYVAGFDVFYPDWKEKRYFVYQELCSKYGFEMQAQKAAAD